MGLGTTNTVLRPCLVDYLVGRRVISVVCGAHHTLALVAKTQRMDAQKGGYRIEKHPQTPATCARCKGDIYTYTESGEECIISDQHTCPLGLELYPRGVNPIKVTGGSLNNLGKCVTLRHMHIRGMCSNILKLFYCPTFFQKRHSCCST